ncbi:TetR/AcrR family transcriptional regulator [Exilibacterium tricleocarpae]|uniref:TetR/AcrR family transcriptional regulator n=1 Tax=Exilibacterium tricleocarpae TaxID=2591008 RepID=A0A545SSR7_9GAMM|nr:TetR/AcrR family transcriptional regulator [Exilibacterium tricleocarpae]TQV67986.1 TetR/AcrR family transcriptional regulator [Exilibacterium tricleocarpae]
MPKVVTAEQLMEREQVIIDAACDIIGELGFAGLTMDAVVARVPYSKGSLYKQFNSTQELLLAITNSGAGKLLALMERAYRFAGGTRERYLARAYAYFLYSQLYPIHFFSELEALSPIVREKASRQRLREGDDLLRQFRRNAERFVRAGVDAGDLVLAPGVSAAAVADSSWSAEFGLAAYNLMHAGNRAQAKARRAALEEKIFWHVNVFLDGLDWRPLAMEQDYRVTWTRLKDELLDAQTGTR